MVDAYAQGRVVFLTYVKQRHKAFLNLLQFAGILLVGVFQVLERARRVGIIAGVYAHLLGIQGGHLGHMRVEVHVGHQWSHVPVGPEPRVYLLQVLGFAHALGGQAHVFSARLDYALGLCHARLGVGGGRGGHRLHAHRPLPTHRRAANLHLGSRAAAVIEQVNHTKMNNEK